MRHVNYREWALYLRSLFHQADIRVEKILDISCGTGSMALNLSELGFVVFGLDESRTMVNEARKKLFTSRHNIPVWVASMTDFRVRRQFHAILCTYDSFNYCRSLSVCGSVLTSVAKALRPGGVFVFDISTTRNSQQNFQNYYDKEQTEHFKYVRQSYFLSNENKQINEFFITRLDGAHLTYHEYHEQKIYSIRALRSIISPNVFDIVGVFDGFSMQPATGKSDRVHFLLKKK